jgi:hypothetical protein
VTESLRYGLLPRREPVGALSDSYDPSPAWTAARKAAFEAERLKHEVDYAAYYIARGPFKISGSISWTLRADDPSRAATLTLHPLPSRSVEDLLKAGIISPEGVDEVALRRECERLRL